jgi:hypothetical protein
MPKNLAHPSSWRASVKLPRYELMPKHLQLLVRNLPLPASVSLQHKASVPRCAVLRAENEAFRCAAGAFA